MALSHEEIKEILDEKGPELLERILLDEMFLSVLVKWRVILQPQRQNLKVMYNYNSQEHVHSRIYLHLSDTRRMIIPGKITISTEQTGLLFFICEAVLVNRN